MLIHLDSKWMSMKLNYNMKFSLYNNYIQLSENHWIIYNSLTDSFLAYKGYLQIPESPVVLKRKNEVLFNELQKIGGVVSKDTDEVAQVKKTVKDVDFDNSKFILHINPTLDCNFHCWYCYENHVGGSRMSSKTKDSVRRLIEKIIESNNEIKHFSLGFFGGEPLLGFKDVVKPLIKYTSEQCALKKISFDVNFTSNGYLITDEIINFLKEYNCSFQITLDGGKKHHDKTRFNKGGAGSFDEIINNVKKLLMNGIRVVLRINYTHSNISSVSEIISILEDISMDLRSYLDVDLQRVWQDSEVSNPFDEVYGVAKEFRRKILSLGYRISNNKIHDSVRNSCYGDKKNHLLINYNGDVFKCTARDFKQEDRYGLIEESGEIVYNEDKLKLFETAKFSKEVCKNCRIAPRCAGGCRTQAVEHFDNPFCLYGYTDEIIDEMILELFEERFLQ